MANDDVMARLESELGLGEQRLQSTLYECDPWYDLSTGKLSEEGYWQALGATVAREPAELRTLLRSVWEPETADQEVLALIRSVRRRVRVSLLSNATPSLESHLRALRIDHLFDPVINSARVGLRKPDPRVFEHALRVLGVPAGAVLFVDDKERNTLVAEELGIPSVVFRCAADLEEALKARGVLP